MTALSSKIIFQNRLDYHLAETHNNLDHQVIFDISDIVVILYNSTAEEQ